MCILEGIRQFLEVVMKRKIIAYDINHLWRVTDKEVRSLLCRRHYPYSSLLASEDRRATSFPRQLCVPDIEVTEEIKLKVQIAFAEVGLPVLFGEV